VTEAPLDGLTVVVGTSVAICTILVNSISESLYYTIIIIINNIIIIIIIIIMLLVLSL
jgi:hypothetical protein